MCMFVPGGCGEGTLFVTVISLSNAVITLAAGFLSSDVCADCCITGDGLFLVVSNHASTDPAISNKSAAAFCHLYLYSSGCGVICGCCKRWVNRSHASS